MSRELTLGWLLGEEAEGSLDKGRGYTIQTNDKLAGDNASPLLSGSDVATVGFKVPPKICDPCLQEGLAFLQAMADQLDQEDKNSFQRR